MNTPIAGMGRLRPSTFFLGLLLLCASTLMYEIALTRLLSVVSWYYLAFVSISMAMFVYAMAFLANVGVARSLDSVAYTPFMHALAVDIGLLALFAVQHSVMARPGFKRVWTRVVPHAIERSTYVLLSRLILLLL